MLKKLNKIKEKTVRPERLNKIGTNFASLRRNNNNKKKKQIKRKICRPCLQRRVCFHHPTTGKLLSEIPFAMIYMSEILFAMIYMSEILFAMIIA